MRIEQNDKGLWRIGNGDFIYPTASAAKVELINKMFERKNKAHKKLDEALKLSEQEKDKNTILDFFSRDDVGFRMKDDLLGERYSFDYDLETKVVHLATIRRKGAKAEVPKVEDLDTFYIYAAKPGAEFDGSGIIDSRSRPFCREMVRLDKIFTREEISRISFQLRYSVFKYAGSYGCRHMWQKVFLPKRPKGEIPRKGKKYENDI
jgi:hypothetical protein